MVTMTTSESVELTRWSMQLAHRDQERRFRESNAPMERWTLALVAAILAIIDLTVLAITLAGAHTLTPIDVGAQTFILILMATAAALIWRARQPHTTRYLVAATLALYAVVATLIATSEGMAFGGALLLLAGVMVVYLTGRYNFVTIVALAFVYSALIIPAWLATTPPPALDEVIFTIIVIVLGHMMGITECARAQSERRILFGQTELLGRLSTTDELTGLTNRRAFRRQLLQAWAQWEESATPMALVMLDLDHFKQFNDTFGHPAGDVALRLVGGVIGAFIPPADGQLGARYGGEEFMCLLPSATFTEAINLAEQLRLTIRQLQLPTSKSNGTKPITLTVSAGVAVPTTSMRHLDDLLQEVDDQLYLAKAAGRDCIRPAVAAPVTDPIEIQDQVHSQQVDGMEKLATLF
ncbi:MAG: GGDEF domain-containing protein [Rhodanobacter sp.]